MKVVYIILLLLFFQTTVHAQAKLYSKEAKISFFSKTAMENIVAQNNKALCVWDTASGQFEFSVLIKGFEFDRALMQEHFNENYMESDKFPKAFFKGKLKADKPVLLQPENSYSATAEGILTIHGISKQVLVPATVSSKNGVINSKASFSVLLADYKIAIPSIVADKINQRINISILVPAYKKL